MDFHQICQNDFCIVRVVSKLNKSRPVKTSPLLKIAKYETGKISQWNCTNFVLQLSLYDVILSFCNVIIYSVNPGCSDKF